MDFKKLGNDSFLEKKYIQAIDHYTKGLESSCLTPEELANLRLNRVACYIKLECFCKGLEDTEIVLSQLPHNTKGIGTYIEEPLYNNKIILFLHSHLPESKMSMGSSMLSRVS